MDPPAGEVLGLLALNDDLLSAILILLTLADLGRACASCRALHRIITSPSFLRRLHQLHPPSLLGLRTFFGSFQLGELPSPAARAVARAADFRFSFLPDPGLWAVRDARGDRFVLDRAAGTDGISTEIAVCDPLFRRYVLLPPIPEGLTGAYQDQKPLWNSDRNRICDVFLADEEAAFASPQSFRVIRLAQCAEKLVVFIFSSASRQWRAIPALSWRGFDPNMPALFNFRPLGRRHRSYAYGCFYWLLSDLRHIKLIMLDMSKMELSPVNIPFPCGHTVGEEFAVVELGESIRRMLKLDGNKCGGNPSLQLFCENSQDHGEGAIEWVLQNQVSLPCRCFYAILGDASGKSVLQGRRHDVCSVAAENYCCMSVDFKTMQLQMVRETLHSGSDDLCKPALYTGYPPSLSSPTV